ncbi:MAG: transcription antitermination factor NusB [Desulfobacteraceae bacterium]|jgi:N utilization substance protein B
MGTRRYARELAMQALYSMDMGCAFTPEALADYRRCFPPQKKVMPYFVRLTDGVLQYKADIDEVVECYSNNWKVDRMACVDRNVLRLAVYELLYCQDIPTKVSINEAIDIAKKFGACESGSFINGILDSIRIALEKNELKTIPQTSLDVGSTVLADDAGKEKS